MTVIRARIIDNFHLELEDELPLMTDNVLIKIVEDSPLESLRGVWGYDVDSADFVEKIRKSKQIETI
ncbi:MAG TPA: hypothetical protein VN372_15255 [Methanospirillum sp.]|nr:hypothetical protein [Methanospirillum sp.]